MNAPFTTRSAAALIALVLASASTTTAQAQGFSEGWTWEASAYFWLPSVGGHTSFPAGSGTSVDVSGEQIIDALKFMLMGNIGAKKGQWGVWTDLAYADFGAKKSASRDFSIGHLPIPGGVQGDFELDLKTTGWTLAGSYELNASPAHSADLLFGARLLDIHQTLAWSISGDISGTPLPGRDGTGSVRLSNWDAIVGLKGRLSLDGQRKWFIPYYLDIGSGDSDLTWQAVAGLGYHFSWGSVVGSYRHLAYEMKSSQQIQSVSFSGPVLGVAFQW